MCIIDNFGNMNFRLKSGNFGHQVNSDKYLQTVFSSNAVLFCGSFMCSLCLCARLFICALWSTVGKG